MRTEWEPTHTAGGFVLLKKSDQGLLVSWDNGLRVRLSRQQATSLARALTEFVEWERW